jgi:hypothetical protein
VATTLVGLVKLGWRTASSPTLLDVAVRLRQEAVRRGIVGPRVGGVRDREEVEDACLRVHDLDDNGDRPAIGLGLDFYELTF